MSSFVWPDETLKKRIPKGECKKWVFVQLSLRRDNPIQVHGFGLHPSQPPKKDFKPLLGYTPERWQF
jgi:hypothetical protein